MPRVNFELATEIINRHLAGAGFERFQITTQVIDWQQFVDAYGMLSAIDCWNNFCTDIFQSLSTDFSTTPNLTLFHYKPFDTAIKTLNSGHLQASYLPAHSDRDKEEFIYFMRQIGHPLADSEQPVPPRLTDSFGEFQLPAQMKSGAFIISFTDSNSNERLWDEFAGRHTGVCFEIEFQPVGENLITGIFPYYYLRGMIYDNELNNRFSFFKRMNTELTERVGYPLMIDAVPQFSKFFKRYEFYEEREIRFAIDLGYLHAWNSAPDITIQLEREREFLLIPLLRRNPSIFTDEPPYQFELKRVICGRQMVCQDYDRILASTNTRFPNVSVVRS